MSTDPSPAIADQLIYRQLERSLDALLKDLPVSERLPWYAVAEAIRKLERAVAAAPVVQGWEQDRLAYSLPEIVARVPASKDTVNTAARNGALRGMQPKKGARWVVSHDALVDWIYRGCPTEIVPLNGRSPRARKR